MKQIDGDEHKALPQGEIINFDTQTEPGMIVPAYKASKDAEQAKSVRATRGTKLAECDWTQVADAP